MYLFDSNTFMEASRLYYGFDLAPGFWAWLTSDGLRSDVASVEAVLEEISLGSGDLVEWAGAAPSLFWRPDTTESLTAVRSVADWAADDGRLYKQSAVDEFMGSADLRLIGQAIALGAVLVTRETSEPASRRRIKIPDVCAAFQVGCIQPFAAYRALGLKLIS